MKITIIFILFAINLSLFAEKGGIVYIKNNGQWHKNVKFKASTREGSIFLEKDKFTFIYYSHNDLKKFFEHDVKDIEIPNLPGFSDSTGLRYHSVQKLFLGANPNPTIRPVKKISTYFNYFQGNDRSKWKGKVPAFNEIIYDNIYPNINLRTYSLKGKMKYDFIVQPHANSDVIQIKYIGADKIRIKNKELIVYTSLGEKKEMAPFVYQLINGDTIEVQSKYILKDNIVSFVFPNGYDASKTLIIDPTIIASTFSGVQNNSENYGHTATYDLSGNMYMGARSYGPQYQVTAGAYMTSYPGGSESIGISKFNPDGTSLIYGTLIGSHGTDDPHSIICSDDAEELYLLGSTYDATDYPSTAGVYQPNFNDDDFQSTEIVISRFSNDGSTLIASTFLGGVDSDGESTLSGFDAHDGYRGEIIHKNGKVYVASFAEEGFPITANALHDWNPDGGQAPRQMGVFLRMSEDLVNLEYSSYFGSAGDNDVNVCHGIKVDNSGNMYVTGLIENPSSASYINWNGANTSGLGGRDAYIIKVSPSGTLLASTLYGTSDDDVAYFVDITNNPNQNPNNQCASSNNEENTFVYIYGLTHGTITPTPGIYHDAINAKQFLAKFSSDLSTLEYQTVIGHNADDFNFIPVAFMVDLCGRVYISGYHAGSGLETENPLTFPNDIYTSGDNFYIAVLNTDAASLLFASYYYGANHVDGGTSRFDPRGYIYQGVCTSDDGYPAGDDYYTTPGCAFPTSADGDFDEAIFKIDLGISFVQAEYEFASDTVNLCAPGTVDFGNNSQFATDYEWDFGDGTTSTDNNPTHTFTSPGTYSIMLVAHDDGACNVRDTFCMTVNVIPCGFTIDASDTLVCDGAPASVSVDVFGALDPVSYEWSNGLPATAGPHTVNPTTTTDYYVTVTDGSGETRIDTATVTVAPPPSATGTVPDLTCGASSVNIDLSPTGGTPNYTFNWSGPGGFSSTDEDPSVSNPGTYIVTISDDNACEVTYSIDVAQVGGFTLSETHNNVLCYGGNTGDIDISITNGTSPFTFDWDNDVTGDNDDTEDITNLTAGTYNLTVTDANSCTGSISIDISQPDSLTLTNTYTAPDCQGAGGGIDLTVSGGTPAYSYAWEGPASLSETSQDISITTGGLYTVTVTDTNACQDTMQVNIAQAGGFSLSETHQDIICYGGNPGSINVTVTGGTSPFNFDWDNDGTGDNDDTEDISNLSEGTYNLTVTDANSCSGELQVNITEPDSISILETHANVDCYNNASGSIDITVSGGTPDYTYEWDMDGTAYSTADDLSNLEDATYDLAVTDANNCKAYLTVNISEPTELITTETHVDATCGGNDGSIDLTVVGGTTAYTYSWGIASNPGVEFSSSQDLTGVNADTYNVTVTDNNGCQNTLNVEITQPDNNLQGTFAITNVSCNGGGDGALDLSVTGGTPNYTYNWSNSQSSEDVTNLSAGVYTVTITDALNCSIIVLDTIEQPEALNAGSVLTHVSCSEGTDGAIDLIVTGGTPTYSYNWDNGATTEDISNLASNDYSVTITDANNCQLVYTVTIGSSNPILTTLNPVNILCYGDANGTVDLEVSGGTPTYSYLWNTSNTTQDITNIGAGTYTVTVTDANGCFVVDSTQIVGVGEPMEVSVQVSNVLCYGNHNGDIQLTVVGGTPNYTYTWENEPHSTPHLRNCYGGEYPVTVTDANGCELTKTYTVGEPERLVSLLPDSLVICQNVDVNIDASVTGGVAPYTYQWSTGSQESYIMVNQDTILPYFLTVTDVNNCVLETNLGVYVHSLPELIIGHDKDTVCQGEPITVGCTALNGFAPYNYTINEETATNSNIVHPDGLTHYTIALTDACNKTDTKELDLFAYTDGLLSVVPDVIEGCSPLMVSFNEISGLEGIWGWEFDDKDVANYDTDQNPTHEFVNDGLFTIKQTLTTKEGCYLERTYRDLIHVFPLPDADFDVDNDVVTEIQPNIYFYNYSTDNTINYWNFNDGETSNLLSPTHQYNLAGNYMVQLVVENNYQCRDTTERLIKVEDVFKVWVPTAFSPDGDNKNEFFGVKGVGILDDDFSLSVYDRWGEKIWEGKAQSDTWDGKYSGNYVQNGVYTWLLHCKGINGSEMEKSGAVTVIR